MNRPEGNWLEVRVGLFVLFGLAVLAWIVVQFAGLGERLRQNYSLEVEFPNASGLLKDSSVLFAGAEIGRVAEKPSILLEPRSLAKGPAVLVKLDVMQEARIPVGSTFRVSSSGLLGDRFVDVLPPEDYEAGVYIEAGSRLAGTRETGLEELAAGGAELIEDLKVAVSNINKAVVKVDEQLLTDKVAEDLSAALASFRKAGETFERTAGNVEKASEKLDSTMEKAEKAMESGGGVMTDAGDAAKELKSAIADLRGAIAKADDMVAKGLAGEGLVATLLTDDELAANVKALFENLRKRGVLFYRDRGEAPEGTRERGTQAAPGRPSR